MGKWRAIIPFTLALFVAAVVYMVLPKAPGDTKQTDVKLQAPVLEEKSGVTIAVASRDLKRGEKILFDDATTVTWRPFPEESLPAGYIPYDEALQGRVVLIPIMERELITEQRLAPSGVGVGGISLLVGTGKRAIAVKGDMVMGMAGLIHPGDRVDVLVTVKDPKRKLEITKIVLEDIVVLATGKEFRDQDREEYSFEVYTLEVTAEEAEKLALAANKGRLQFALRNASDSETVLTKGTTVRDLLRSFGNFERRPRSKTKRTTPRKPTFTVEVIKDGKVLRQKFN
jgi:pilus assembly protein CpaB